MSRVVVQGDTLVIDGQIVEGARFDDPRVRDIRVMNGATVVRSTFAGLRIVDGSFGGGLQMSELVDCTFDGCRLSIPVPGRVRFTRCRFVNVWMSTWICRNAEFDSCSFSGKLSKVVFDAALLPSERVSLGRESNMYRNNDFRDCVFRDVSFRGGVNLDPGLMPVEEGGIFLPDAAGALSHALDRVADIGDLAAEKWARDILKIDMDVVERGQRQVYYSKADLASSKPVEAKVLAFFRHLLKPFDPR